MNPIPKWLVGSFVVFALLGFADAAYLTAEHVRGTVPPCSIVSGCEQVLTSRYATVAGVPVSALGMAYYGTLLVLLLAYVDTSNRRIIHYAAWLTGAGLLGTLYFLYVQAFILSAFCMYCLGSAVTSILLFIVGLRVARID